MDPARLGELEERLDLIHSLKRKYGATLTEVIAFGEEARAKLQSLESRDAELARLNAELQKLDAEIGKVGKKLRRGRKKTIPQLARAVSKQLGDLGFRQSQFNVEISTDAKCSLPRLPVLMRLNFNSRQIPASRPSRCGPSRRPAKWRA